MMLFKFLKDMCYIVVLILRQSNERIQLENYCDLEDLSQQKQNSHFRIFHYHIEIYKNFIMLTTVQSGVHSIA